MDRRTVLGTALTGGAAALSGCSGLLGRTGRGGVDAELSLVETDIKSADPPVVEKTETGITVRGRVSYGSTNCGTVRVAHAKYQETQNRVDILVVAGDAQNKPNGCSDAVTSSGYEIEVTYPEQASQMAVTEHHVFGEAYSTTIELN